MTDERDLLRRVHWREVVPGLMLVRCFRLAISIPALFLATIGTLAMPVGPWLARQVITAETGSLVPPATEEALSQPLVSDSVATPVAELVDDDPFDWVPRSIAGVPLGIVENYLTLVRPFARLFDRQSSLGQWFGNLGVALWYLVIWSLCGGAITRIAVVRLGLGENLPFRQAVQHTLRNSGWYVSAPLFPLAGIACAVVPLLFLGLVMRLGAGVLVAGLLWPLVLLGGLFMAVLAVGLLFGWLLMWPTLSAEESSDSFQAFSNSFSFTFQRPLQYLAYAIVAVVLGSMGGLFVEGFARAVIALPQWGLTFGSGADRLNDLVAGDLDSNRFVWMGTGLMELANQLVLAIAAAFHFSFLFCAASAIYLLLRREVDQTDFDEVYVSDTVAPFSLPGLRPSSQGVPEVDDPPSGAGETPTE